MPARVKLHKPQFVLTNGSKDDRFIPVKKYAIFHVPADGAGQDDFLQVAPLADEVFYRIAVRHADYVLLNDGAVVKDFSDVVAGGADQFDPRSKA